jgi:hypothetical protein
MKTRAQALADALSALSPIGDERAIIEEDVIAILADVADTTEAGAAMRLPTQGASGVTGSVTGTSFAAMDLFDGGSATPTNGGRGLAPNIAAGTMTVESGGDGWYELKYHCNITASQDTELALNRNRGGANVQAVESRCAAGVLSSCSGSDLVLLQEGDVLRMVCRTGNGLTSNWEVFSAQWTALRVLPT